MLPLPDGISKLLRLTALCVLAQPGLQAVELRWAAGGAAGGIGTWDYESANWLDIDGPVAFIAGADAIFDSPSARADIGGSIQAGAIRFEQPGTEIRFQSGGSGLLQAGTVHGNGWFTFTETVASAADAYPDLATIRARGLELAPMQSVRLEADLVAIDSGSPILAVRGAASRVEFAGRWQSDSGSVYSWLRLEEDGSFVLTGESDMRFIKDAFYTLQLWVTGDGTGTLELAPDFQADRTEDGTQTLGLGSIRMGAGTLISHASGNLPLGYRPQPDGSAQTNGHLVFENANGARWLVRSQPQVYPGAVWIYRSMELDAEEDLTHVGVTEAATDYTAYNGWSVLAPVTVTKSGLGSLVLAGEQSWASGSSLFVKAGAVVFQSDPGSGTGLNGVQPGAQLSLLIEPDARAEFNVPGSLRSILLKGHLLVGAPVSLLNQGQIRSSSSAVIHIHLTADTQVPWISVNGSALMAGKVVVTRDPAYMPNSGTAWTLLEATSLNANLLLEDRSGLGLELTRDGNRLLLNSGQAAPDLPGTVALEDDFSQPTQHWADLSTVPLWGSPAAAGTAFEQVEGVIRLRRSGPHTTAGFTSYTLGNGLKTFTALDHRFSQPVDHATHEVTVDFRLRWPVASADTGEGGRVIVALNHSYPVDGLDLTTEGQPGSRLADFSAQWWARPAYHVRLRNSTSNAGLSFLQYGGGLSPLGEYERTDNWWLPGFISGAGQVAPGTGDDFPVNSWTRSNEGLASSSFRTFRYRILPDRQELWRDDNDDGFLQENELKISMPLPLESTAPLYQYFTTFEGLRIFWNGVDNGNGSGQAELDWLRVIVHDDLTPVADAGPDVYAKVLVGGLGRLRLDASASSDPEALPLTYCWFSQGQPLAVTSLPVAHIALPEGTHPVELMILDPAGNAAFSTTTAIVTRGKVRPVAIAGNDQLITAANSWFGIADVSAAASFAPEGSLVRYRWSTGNPDRVLAESASPDAQVALPIGANVVTLTVWDDRGEQAQSSLRIIVNEPGSSDPPTVIYRENFSRLPITQAGEMAIWDVDWNLMRYDGDPVASIKFDGNAHRCLNVEGSATYLTRVQADPDGDEYDAPYAGGHVWMNQMPSLNASPAEWLIWTDEYTIDRSLWDVHSIQFHATDSSPERVEWAPAVRIAGQWYIGWEWRVETYQSNWWSRYTMPLGTSNWVLFEPASTFSVRKAQTVPVLPDGDIEAFGFYMFKEYGWYINSLDNFTILAQPRKEPDRYGNWVARNFPQAVLLSDLALDLTLPSADYDQDGWANIYEYASGSNPALLQTSGSLPRVFLESGKLVLELPVNPQAGPVSFQARVSSDLKSWQTFSAVPEVLIDPLSGAGLRRWSIDLSSFSDAATWVRWEASLPAAD